MHLINNFNNINSVHKIPQVDVISKAVFSLLFLRFILFRQTRISSRYETLTRHCYLNNKNNTCTKLDYDNCLLCIYQVGSNTKIVARLGKEVTVSKVY